METKKSKVTAIAENVSQYAGSNGMVFYHQITFENGDSGKYGSKSEKCEKFKIGTEADYTIETKVNGNYTNITIKPVQAQSSVGGFKSEPRNQKAIIAQSSVGYAVEFLKGSNDFSTDTLFKTADQIYSYVLGKGGIQ